LSKRTFDVLFASAAILFLFPWLFPLIAAAIQWTSEGPVLFKQKRRGRNQRPFICYKFRSMIESPAVAEGGKFHPVTVDDPRVTRVGRFLRRTHLDELPQFVNVLRGEMSVVGPRPHPIPLDRELESRIPSYMRRYLVRPGLTGLAQIRGWDEASSLVERQKRVEHDLWYIEHRTFWLDLSIVGLTLWKVLFPPPASRRREGSLDGSPRSSPS
jgi:putative colanic acid biosynthesis UDP-glucose lipid carrier transferase